MGAGAGAGPTRIRVAELRESSNDPLSRAVRYRLEKDHGIEGGVPIVFSLEKPKAKLLPFQGTKEEETPTDYQIVPGFKVRNIPVLELSLQYLVKLWPPMWLLSLPNRFSNRPNC